MAARRPCWPGWNGLARFPARVPEVQPPEDPMTADLLGQLRWVINSLEQGQTQGETPTACGAAGASCSERSAPAPGRSRARRAVGAIPTAAAIRAELDPACLVAIFGLHEQLHAVVLTRTPELAAPTRHHVRRRAARHAGQRRLRRARHGPGPASPARTRREVRWPRDFGRWTSCMLAPLDLPAGPVVLLPPGRLAALPWAELPVLPGRPLTVAPSAAAWLGAHARSSTAIPARSWRSPDPVCAGPTSEVAAVAETWPGCQTLTGSQATGRGVPGRDQRRPPGPRRRPWPAPAGEPAVLLDQAGRRSGGRVRPRPGARPAAAGGALGLRPRARPRCGRETRRWA